MTRLIPRAIGCSRFSNAYLYRLIMYRIDLHTHSIISYDGGIGDVQYRDLLSQKYCIAVTDHNEISKAVELRAKFGEQIIVGEEILTLDGEIVGLFLTSKIEPGLDLMETVKRIKAQGGLTYVPHPFELARKGLSERSLFEITDLVDVVEVFNARLRGRGPAARAEKFASERGITKAAASDAHGIRGVGWAYCEAGQLPTRENLQELLRSAKLIKRRAPWLSYLDPLRNKLKKRF